MPAAGEEFDFQRIVQKPTERDMHLFDKAEDKFQKKIDVLFALSEQNGLSYQQFAERVDKIVMTSDAQGNPEQLSYVKERLRAYRVAARATKREKSDESKEERSFAGRSDGS